MSKHLMTARFAVEPALPCVSTARARTVAEKFGVLSMLPTSAIQSLRTSASSLPQPDMPHVGEVMFVRGPSGSGKSSLLRGIVRRAARHWRVCLLDRVALADVAVVDLFGDEPLEQTLPRLARVGLAEVWTWLRRPAALSEGQRWRLRLAIALYQAERARRPTLLACDEFAALLDRVSACVVSNVLRRAVARHADRLAAVVATSHDDLAAALDADVTIDCDFGEYAIRSRREREGRAKRMQKAEG